MIEAKDICTAYLEGYFYAKITEQIITVRFIVQILMLSRSWLLKVLKTTSNALVFLMA